MQFTSQTRIKPDRTEIAMSYFQKKALASIESAEVYASSLLGYDMSAAALSVIFQANEQILAFSEEALNGYIFLMNKRIQDSQGYDFVFDTLLTSMVLANIYNGERVTDLLTKRNISLDYFHRLIFTVVDISNKGSLQLVVVDIPLHTVTV